MIVPVMVESSHPSLRVKATSGYAAPVETFGISNIFKELKQYLKMSLLLPLKKTNSF